MTRVETILSKARAQLADPAKTRWPDEVLLAFLSEAQQELSNECLLLKKFYEFPIYDKQNTYQLPDDFIRLEAAWILNEKKTPLKFKSYEDLNKIPDWQSKEGDPEYFIYDIIRKSRECILYPTPSKEVVDAKVQIEGDILGVITDIEGAVIKPTTGTLSDINSNLVQQESPYGIVTALWEVKNFIRVCYHYKPKDLTSLEDELEIAPAMDKALKHYLVFIALRNDMDSFNRQVANEEYMFYANEVKGIKSDSSRDYLYTQQDLLETPYNGGF